MNNVKQKIFDKTLVTTSRIVEDFDSVNTEWTLASVSATITYLEDLTAASKVALTTLVKIQDMFADESITSVTFSVRRGS
jgi:hypothetical protein